MYIRVYCFRLSGLPPGARVPVVAAPFSRRWAPPSLGLSLSLYIYIYRERETDR